MIDELARRPNRNRAQLRLVLHAATGKITSLCGFSSQGQELTNDIDMHLSCKQAARQSTAHNRMDGACISYLTRKNEVCHQQEENKQNKK